MAKLKTRSGEAQKEVKPGSRGKEGLGQGFEFTSFPIGEFRLRTRAAVRAKSTYQQFTRMEFSQNVARGWSFKKKKKRK